MNRHSSFDTRLGLIALALGVISTLVAACVMPHVWFAQFKPAWASIPVRGVTSQTPAGAVSCLTRPFVDLYAVSPKSFAEAGRGGDPPQLPAVVRTDADPDTYVRVDTALEGWPMRAMASEAWVPRANLPVEYRCNIHLYDAPNGPVLVPLRPIPVGFAVDTIVYAAAWFCVLNLRVLRPSWWREGSRLRGGRCPSCGYDLGWNLAGGCNECGWRKPTTSDVSVGAKT